MSYPDALCGLVLDKGAEDPSIGGSPGRWGRVISMIDHIHDQLMESTFVPVPDLPDWRKDAVGILKRNLVERSEPEDT